MSAEDLSFLTNSSADIKSAILVPAINIKRGLLFNSFILDGLPNGLQVSLFMAIDYIVSYRHQVVSDSYRIDHK